MIVFYVSASNLGDGGVRNAGARISSKLDDEVVGILLYPLVVPQLL
jgi:hypothetical protein